MSSSRAGPGPIAVAIRAARDRGVCPLVSPAVSRHGDARHVSFGLYMARPTSSTRRGVPDSSLYVVMYGVKGRDSSPCGSRPIRIIIVVVSSADARVVVATWRGTSRARVASRARSEVRRSSWTRVSDGFGTRMSSADATPIIIITIDFFGTARRRRRVDARAMGGSGALGRGGWRDSSRRARACGWSRGVGRDGEGRGARRTAAEAEARVDASSRADDRGRRRRWVECDERARERRWRRRRARRRSWRR